VFDRLPASSAPRRRHPISRRERLRLLAAVLGGIAQGATRALLDLLLTGR
jgi:hypothetical protein